MKPSRELCLACVVLEDCSGWLGTPTPLHLEAFLTGAYFRAGLTQPTLPAWRIYGPLNDPAFSAPLVARTGDSSLTIRWARASEMIHFRADDAMAELRSLTQEWFEAGFDAAELVGEVHADGPDPELAFWKSFVQRPGMFLGSLDGWSLYCFLHGLVRGGDWLGLPSLPRFRSVTDELARRSREAYGHDYAVYRVHGARWLLDWVAPK